MDYAHSKGVVLRDVKPANGLISADVSLKLVNFRLVYIVTNEAITATRVTLGAYGCMPPKQATGSPDEVGVETNIYTIGTVLYTMVTGRPSLRDRNVVNLLISVRQQLPVPPGRLTPEIDQDIETTCLKCLEKSPADRFESAG